MSFHYWVCDNCHKWFPAEQAQNPILVQQRSERIFGMQETLRPVEKLVICDRCVKEIRSPGGRHL